MKTTEIKTLAPKQREEAIRIVKKAERRYKDTKLSNSEILTQMSDIELSSYIALRTFAFGRNWRESVKNAASHMSNKAEAIKSFSRAKN